MSTEENKALVRKYYELVDKGDKEGIMRLFSDKMVWRFTGVPEPLNKEGVTGLIQAFRTAFPDMKHILDQQVAEGDQVVTPLTFRGTQKGEMQGIPPSGKQVEIRGISIHRVVGGKIVGAETVVDMMALMQQIGAIPKSGK